MTSSALSKLSNKACRRVGRYIQPRRTAVVIATEIYTKQGGDWWYLNPASGQHAFCYSHAAMTHIATRFGFGIILWAHYTCFSQRTLTKTEQRLLVRAVSPRAQKWMRAFLGYRLSFSPLRDSGLVS